MKKIKTIQNVLLENGLVKANQIDADYFNSIRSNRDSEFFNSNYSDCLKLLKYLEKSKLDKFLYVSSGFYPFVLLDLSTLTFIPLMWIRDDFDLIDSYINRFRKRMNQPLNPEKILTLTDKAYKIMIFRLLIEDNKVTQDDKRRLALSVYQHSEYHFNDFDFRQLFIDTKSDADDLRVLYLKVNGKKIKIWRGMSSKSLALEDTLSWTLDKSVALKFANRFNSGYEKGILYSAIVTVSDVLAYVDDEESEVLVDYNDLESVKRENI